ncbi:hypothetical protein EYC84_005636 [Monilinia fructicola]|uniref:Uncharacterized protein n=1 Tax=Monilinia fructicola TaxID=38448 RepID=A0A5M9JX30_MONFR|nr:hypothetical protein EYC84_005636 [Monilinia fructicola]
MASILRVRISDQIKGRDKMFLGRRVRYQGNKQTGESTLAKMKRRHERFNTGNACRSSDIGSSVFFTFSLLVYCTVQSVSLSGAYYFP